MSDINKTIAYITPDYLEVRPLGFNPEAGTGSGEGDEGGGTNAPVPFNPFDHISELERIIEDYLAKERTFDNQNLRDKLRGTIRALEELKTEVKAINGQISAMVKNKDVAVTTDNEALAQAIQQINAKFGEINASIDQLKQAYASENSAIAQKFEQLKASLPGELTTQITKNVETKVEKGLDGKIRSMAADMTNLISRAETELVKVTNAAAIATAAKEYLAKVKSLITDKQGRITGWQFSDGSAQQSKFEVMADNFRIANSSGTYTPFQIIGRKIYFSGDVAFDQFKQTNTIIKIERFENNSAANKIIQANFNSKTNACIVLYNVSDFSKSHVALLGRASNGAFNDKFLMGPNGAAVMLYLNQQDLVER